MQPFSIRKIETMLINKSSRALSKLGNEWLQAAKQSAPSGPTGQLKTSFVVIDRPGTLHLRMVSSMVYAKRVMIEALRHVPRDIVGRKGWHDTVVGRGTRKQRYYRGLAMARKRGVPQYVWNYMLEGLNSIGGRMRYQQILRSI